MFTFGISHIIFQRKLRNINQYFFLFYGLIIPLRVPKPPLRNFARLQRGTHRTGKSFFFEANERWVESLDGKNYFKRLNLNLYKNILICDIDREKIKFYQGYTEAIAMTFDEFQSNNYPNLNLIILAMAQSNNLSNLNKLKEK